MDGMGCLRMTCLPVAYQDCSSPFYQNFTGDTPLEINGDRNLKITRFFEKEETSEANLHDFGVQHVKISRA